MVLGVNGLFCCDRHFYREFFGLFSVLVLQNVITLAVNLADNLMLGAYSETALAGVAVVNQMQFLYQQLLLALGEAVVIIGSQYFGRCELEPVRQLTALALRLGLGLALVFFLAASLFPGEIIAAFAPETDIIVQGVLYLGIVRLSYPFFAVTQLLLASLRSTGTVRIALYLSVSTLLVNCTVNYALIYGHWGAPELGVAGAAIGTVFARALEMLLLLLYLHQQMPRLAVSPFYMVGKISRELCHTYLHLLWPMLVVNGLWGANNAAQNAILGHMDVRAIAANSVASTLYLLVKSAGSGSAAAASFLVGRAIGCGGHNLRQLARTLQLLFLGIGLGSGLLLYGLRIPVLSLYKLSPGTMQLADTFLVILAVVCVGMSYQMSTNAGIIKGGGAVRYCMVLDLVSIWCICLPAAYLLAFAYEAPPALVVCALNADQLFKAVPAFWKCNYGHWAYKLAF